MMTSHSATQLTLGGHFSLKSAFKFSSEDYKSGGRARSAIMILVKAGLSRAINYESERGKYVNVTFPFSLISYLYAHKLSYKCTY
jgi:hypothetical protein